MKRKLVRHGESTMTISLPSKWLKRFNICKGDEIDIQEKENHLIVGLGEEKSKTEISVGITSLEESSIRTIIANAYRLGYDKVNLKFDSAEAMGIITHIVEKSLLGFEIIKKGDGFCVIESVTEPAKEQFDNIFSKVFLNIDELFNVLELMLDGKKSEFEEIDRKIQQYDNFCRRIIAKRGVYENNFLEWSFHSSLGHGSRELYKLLSYLSKNNVKLDKVDIDIILDVKKVFEIIKQSYVEKNINLLEKLHNLEKKLTYDKGYKALNKSSNPVVLFHLMVCLKHFYLSSSPLIGILISKSGND